ncbi:MAG: hypothetical protein WCD18_00935 [Thermosynechococcaceae cyanobacterium]
MKGIQTPIQGWLLSILLLNLVSTGIHYWDNYVGFDHYPMPAWITPNGVWISWLVLTVFGCVGYWLYRQQKFWLAYACLAIYAIAGVSTPGHYVYAPLNHFSLKMNVMILSDGLVGASLIAFLVWSVVVDKPWQGAQSLT